MRLFRLIALCAVLSSSFAMVQAQEGGMPPMGAPEEMNSVAFMLGEWDVTMKVRMAPDADWMESKGSAKTVMELDGCVQRMYFDGEMMGMPFKGQDTLTYNRETKQFESFWIDSMSAHASVSYGNWEGDALVSNSEDVNMGQKYHMRTTTKKVSDNEVHFVMEMSMDGEDYFESMKMVYTKKG